MNEKMQIEISVTEAPSAKTLMKLLNINPVVSLNHCNPEGKDLDVFVKEGIPDEYSSDIVKHIVKYEFRHNTNIIEKRMYNGTVSEVVDGHVVNRDIWSHLETL